MKKHLMLIVFLCLVCAGITNVSHADNLQNISLDYCTTTGNTLSFAIDPGIQTGICYTLTNVSEQELTVKINFIDGTFTNDQQQNKACLDEASKENFGQYITNYTELVTLSGNQSKKLKAKLLYPKGSDGLYHGCITYSVVNTPTEEATGESSNFTILMRKAKFIDVLVGHPENVTGSITLKNFTTVGASNLSKNPKIRIYQDPGDNKYIVELTVQNLGGVEEDVVITGVASNFLTYKDTFVETRKLLKGQEFVITHKLDDIPNYNLKVDVQVAYTPVVSGLPDFTPKTSVFYETASIFIINIITIITAIAILILIIIIIFIIRSSVKRRKNNSQIIGTPNGVYPSSSGQTSTVGGIPPTTSK